MRLWRVDENDCPLICLSLGRNAEEHVGLTPFWQLQARIAMQSSETCLVSAEVHHGLFDGLAGHIDDPASTIRTTTSAQPAVFHGGNF